MNLPLCAAFAGTLAVALSFSARADCTLTNTGLTPLCDLGPVTYLGYQGGLYPGGSNQRPAAHEAAGVDIAVNSIRPRDTSGNVDTNNGKIVLLSIGMSNTTQEWANGANDGTNNNTFAFKYRADTDPSKNPRLVIADGAQGGNDAPRWTNANAGAWTNVPARLTAAGVNSNQVQAIWVKLAIAGPSTLGPFPNHALTFQNQLAQVVRAARRRFPNLAIAYFSSRTRAYVADLSLNPEPYAYESAFSVQWLIGQQLAGQLNYNPTNGTVEAPWLSWSPYLWADGTTPRSDGFVWNCGDVRQDDFTHPAHAGVAKVADQLLSFFKTDPTARPWFLKQTVTGTPPVCAPAASVTNGVAPLAVNFSANASDPGGAIRDVQWNFDDGTSSTNANPQKTFRVPGAHRVRVTVTDTDGNTTTAEQLITVTAGAPPPLNITTSSPLPAGTNGVSYALAFAATGGTAPYTWSLASGALPSGLALNTNGNLAGMSSATGAFNFNVRVTDALSAMKTNSYALTINAASTSDGPLENFADGSQGRTTSYLSHTGEVIPGYVRKPAGSGPFPLVLLIHAGGASPGGTYTLGRAMQPPLTNFMAAGFAIYSMDYSGTNPGGALSTHEWELAARAIETAQRLSYVDARRVAMVGQNHGGMVTALAASRLDLLCAVPCGPIAIDPLGAWEFQQGGGLVSPALQSVINQTVANYGVPMATLATNPAAYGYRDVTDDAPTIRCPLLLVSGRNDSSSPTNVMNNYGANLTAAGKYFETYYPSNGPHGFVFFTPLIAESHEFANRAVIFLQKYFSLADTDADGLPDGWELSRFGSLAQGPLDDPDGDSRNNFAEWRAATHPLDAASVLRITSITNAPGQTVLRFPLVPGLGHVIETNNDHTLTNWSPVPSPVFTEPATGHAEWVDPGGAATSRSYRVRVP